MIDKRPIEDFNFTQDEYDRYQSGEEVWKDVDGAKGYKVSTNGNVCSMKRKFVLRDKILNKEVSHAGYFHTAFSANNKCYKKYNHVIVGKAFLKNPFNKPEVNHIDLKRNNPHLSNLEFCTPKENIQHSWANTDREGTWKDKFGKDHPESKAVNQYSKDGVFIAMHESQKEATKATGVKNTSISRVALGFRYSAGGYLWRFAVNCLPLPIIKITA